MATAPQTTPYDRYRVRESRSLLFVPGGSANQLDLGLDQPVSHRRNHREQSEKYRRRPSNRQIVPLPLRFKPSMLQDFERGRKTEVDFINGYVVTLGHASGVPVHMNAAITGLVHQIERGVLQPTRDRMNDLAAQTAD